MVIIKILKNVNKNNITVYNDCSNSIAKLFEIMDTEVHSLRVVISDDQFISLKLSMQSEKMSMTDHVGPNIKKSINQAHAKVTTYNNN
ncbi:hypothetical protein U3516DRAFT_765067 [Neocallimastix sp. 'constans']